MDDMELSCVKERQQQGGVERVERESETHPLISLLKKAQRVKSASGR